MSALLIRRRRPIGEPSGSAVADRDTGTAPGPIIQRLDGTAGAGRICAALLELGVTLAGLQQAVVGPAATGDEIDAVELDGTDAGDGFDLVVLGSHLVNVPEPERRSAFLRLATRHLAASGRLIVEHHPTDWAETAEDVEPTPGGSLGMVDVRRDPPFVSAVSVYDAFGRLARQPFTARVLSDSEIAAELAGCGLEVRRRLGATWVEATRVGAAAPRRATRGTGRAG